VKADFLEELNTLIAKVEKFNGKKKNSEE